MSALDGVLEAGDLVTVTYYLPLPAEAGIEAHRANGIYKVCERVTLHYVGERDDVTQFSFVDHCHPSCGGVSFGDTSWADVEHVAAEGALF